MLIIQVQCPIYKFIYPESVPVFLAGDTSERQSLTRTITHYINEGLDGGGGGVWNSLISKNLVHYSLSLKYLLIL